MILPWLFHIQVQATLVNFNHLQNFAAKPRRIDVFGDKLLTIWFLQFIDSTLLNVKEISK